MSSQSDAPPGGLSIPKGGGAVHGIGETFSPDLFTGTANFSVPIALPAGRNEFQPQMRLDYSTGNGNGPFGLGWALSVPGISRKTSRGLPRYDDSDTFLLSGAEDLVPIAHSGDRTTFRPRTEGLFARIARVRNVATRHDYWEVATKDGLVSTYGTPGSAGTDPAVVAAPDDRTKVFQWRLTETADCFGNRIVYEYLRDKAVERPHRWDQLYLKRVRYADFENAGATAFLVSMELSYDTDRHDPLLASLSPPVRLRDDAFSEYRSTFEIRTRRRCSLIVVRSHPVGVAAIPIRAYRLIYADERTDMAEGGLVATPHSKTSLLSRIAVVGFDDAGTPVSELPPLDFAYSRFEPAKRRFVAVPRSGIDVPSISGPNRDLVDLHGAGLPDIVELSGAVHYWRNLGGGRFATRREMRDAPAGLSLSDAGVALMDANGDGRADLLVNRPGMSACFSLEFGPAWKRRPAVPHLVPSFDLHAPEVQLMDLDGDGVTDALRAGVKFECFFNDPEKGWHAVRTVSRGRLEDFPDVVFSDPRVRVADMSGDGLQDIVLVHSGSVQYWPNRGRGDWGARITMQANPRFPTGYDPQRVLLGDLDGDGLADLVYVDNHRVLIWFNRSGNGWSVDPVVIPGTPRPTDTDSLRIVDLYGNGTSGLLFSTAADRGGQPTMYFLDLTGGVKPHLLTAMDNSLGATTRVEYEPSTHFFLEDEQRPEMRWRTPLPFPVQTVARVTVVDHLSGGTLSTTYRYHRGYWDGTEHEFRGFGLVEQFDTETFRRGQSTVAQRYFSPPTLTRTWFHQGPVGNEFGRWEEQDYSSELWSGDNQLLGHRQATDAFLLRLSTRRARRDALRALRGSRLRTELYALDGSAYEHRPYTVMEMAYGLREVSPAPDPAKRRSIFFPFQTAQRTTQWERGDDPLTAFSLIAEYDEFGRQRQQTTIAMPRRSAKRRPVETAVVGVVQPDETHVLVTHMLTHYARPDPASPGVLGGRYIHDRVWQTHGFEAAAPTVVVETDPDDVTGVLRDQYDTARQLHVAYVASLRQWLPGTSSPAGLSLTTHVVNHFDGPAFAGRDDDLVVYGALTRAESLVFTPVLLDAVYADSAGSRRPAYLGGTATLPAGAPAGFGTALGYQRRLDPPYQDGWYADIKRQQFDFQTNGTAPPGWSAWPTRGQVVTMRDGIAHDTVIALDRHWLLPIAVTDAIGLRVSAIYNLRTFLPEAVTDANGNTTKMRFSPHGLPSRSWLEGRDDGHQGPGGGSDAKPELTWTYDLLAYHRTRSSDLPQPASVRTAQRVHHASDDISDEVIESVDYSNGFGRLIQKRTQAEARAFGARGDDVGLPLQAGVAPSSAIATLTPDRVIVSGWMVYDNKGALVEKFEPFFDRGWAYEPEADAKQGQHVEMYHDPRGQVIRTINADGSQHRVIYGRPKNIVAFGFQANDTEAVPASFEPTPWETSIYDAADLAPVSFDETGLSLSARSPANHHFTPSSAWIDGLGRTICQVNRNGTAPGIDWHVTRSTYDVRGNLTKIVDALGRPAFDYRFDLANRSLRVDSIDGGLRTSVLDAVNSLVEYRDSKGAVTLRTYDGLNRLSTTWARNDAAAASVTLRERVVYGDGGLATQAVTAREVARQRNALGRPVEHWDEGGVLRFEAYDFKGNLLSKTRAVVADATLAALPAGEPWIPNWSEPNSGAALDDFGYTTDVAYDGLNRPTTITCPQDVDDSRRVLRPRYNQAGALDAISLLDSTSAADDDYVVSIAYNAAGRRVLVEYGNGVMTRYAYDRRTLRLARMRTERIATPRVPEEWRGQGDPLQDCSYSYDVLGNMVSVDERVPGCGVDGSLHGRDRLVRAFEYDALSRLRAATGRSCQGSLGAPSELPNCGSYDAPYSPGPPTPTQSNGPMVTELYRQTFDYDPCGNTTEIDHDALRVAGALRLWVRRFGLGGGASQLWRTAPNNRLTTVEVGGTTYTYTFDANGNLSQQNVDTFHTWDHADRMVGYRVQSGNQPSKDVRYLYGADGLRVKKWIRKAALEESTVYVDELFEDHRSPDIPTNRNSVLHVMDDESRVATVRVGPSYATDAAPAVAYHLSDHLGNSVLVVADNGAWVNREELFPYGETSFGCYRRKRYRLSGKETDEESGASYHGSRYYIAWLGRWASCDPLGVAAGLNVYLYCSCNPTCRSDPEGTSDAPADGLHELTAANNVDGPDAKLARAEQRLFDARLAFASGAGASLLEGQLNNVRATAPFGDTFLPAATVGAYDRADRGQESWNPLEQALNEFSIADEFAGQGFRLLSEGRDDEANRAFGNAGYWYGKSFISCVNLGMIAGAGPGILKAGGKLALEGVGRLPRFTGGRISPFGHLRRFFVQDTLRHPGVGNSWGGRLLQRLFPGASWEQGHIWIQRSWFRVGGPNQLITNSPIANTGLQRLGNAGWNLMPLPRALNNPLGRMPVGTALFAGGVYSLLGLELYWSGSKVKELAETVNKDD